MSPNQLLAKYLVHSCLYYEFGVALMPDAEFDLIAQKLRVCWETIDHPHKKLVDFRSLKKNTSGFYLKYPSIVRACAADIAIKIPGSLIYQWRPEQVTAYVVNQIKNTPKTRP